MLFLPSRNVEAKRHICAVLTLRNLGPPRGAPKIARILCIGLALHSARPVWRLSVGFQVVGLIRQVYSFGHMEQECQSVEK